MRLLQMNFHAHTTPGPEEEWEPLARHLTEVAELAARFAGAFEAEEWGRLAGQWHDLGKYSREFQSKLRGERVQVEHTGAGAALAKELAGPFWEALAFVIAGHHAGLCNHLAGEDGKLTPLDERVKRAGPALEECRRNLATQSAEEQAAIVPAQVDLPIPARMARGQEDAEFSRQCFIRLLFSALVDADSIATERFCDAGKLKPRLRAEQIYDALDVIQARLDAALYEMSAKAPPTVVNAERVRILQWCRAAALREPGFFSLNVPTGGGKTLASMSFALRHVVAHRAKGMRRVIVAVPYTSIIEQNADAYARALGAHNVVEHHSNLDDMAEGEENNEASLRRRLACENWDAPVIVTTNVQLFESLFTHKRSRARKLHNIAGSVIILDEAQCVPVGYLALIVPMLRELVEHYGCTVVISTATQPAWKQRKSVPFGLPEGMLRPIIPVEEKLSRSAAFDRVAVEWPESTEPVPYAELAARLAAERCVLTIVHRKKDAQALAQMLARDCPGEPLFHLSTNMCPAHRRETLIRIRAAVQAFREHGFPCRVVGTQLVEAGVDLDFPVVYRAMAGVDSIAQAAGRCNREGKLAEKGRVVVFHAETPPPDGHLRHCMEITNQMITESQSALDLRDPEVYEGFFVRLYMRQDLDAKKLLRHAEALNFETLGREFRLIEDSQTVPIVVLYNEEARERLRKVQAIARGAAGEDVAARFAFRALQPYTVAVWPKGVAALGQALEPLFPGSTALMLDPQLYPASYDAMFGIVTDDEPQISASLLIV
jgi:CRISPR-associated endonuclease/helicase Cas3